MNKKGLVNWQLWIFNLFTVILFASTVMLVTNSTVNSQLETSDLEIKLLAQRLLYSPECFAAQDTTKTLIGAVDKIKLTEETMRTCLNATESLALRVKYKDQNLYHNETEFKDLDPISFSNQYMTYEDSFLVRIRDKGKDAGFQILNIKVIKRK